MLSLNILRSLRTLEDYNRYRGSIPINAVDTNTATIVNDIDKYYKLFPDCVGIDFISFRDLFFSVWHKGFDKETISYYDKVLKRVDQDIDTNVRKLLINSMIELQTATDVANLIQTYESGKEVNLIDEITKVVNDASERKTRREARVYEEPDFNDLLHADTNNEGLTFRQAVLNRHIRPLRGGDFIIMAGRPDQGKTSFISDAITHMSPQCPTDRPILYLTNEGVRGNIIKRAISAALGDSILGLVERQSNGTLRDDYYTAIGGKLGIQVEDIGGFTNIEVAELVEQVNPSLVVLDMIDKVNFIGMPNNSRTDQVLEEQYSWFRELGIKLDYATIATSQISAAACESENTQMWPSDHMLKDSRTGKQGACDVILMMGHSEDPMKQGLRYFSTPKNKLAPPGAGELRATVKFDKDISRFTAV